MAKTKPSTPHRVRADAPAVLMTNVYADRAGEWRWRVVAAGNGNIVATSGEGYTRRIDCERMLVRIADVLARTVSGYRRVP